MYIIKEDAINLINKMPNHVTWDDIMYELYVKNKLATALEAAEDGRVISHEDVKKRFIPQ